MRLRHAIVILLILTCHLPLTHAEENSELAEYCGLMNTVMKSCRARDYATAETAIAEWEVNGEGGDFEDNRDREGPRGLPPPTTPGETGTGE